MEDEGSRVRVGIDMQVDSVRTCAGRQVHGAWGVYGCGPAAPQWAQAAVREV